MGTSDKSHPKLELDLDELDRSWSVPPAADAPASAPPPSKRPGNDEPTAREMKLAEIRAASEAETTVNEPPRGAKPAKSPELAATLREMNEHLASRDWSHALVLADQVLAEDRDNADAKRAAQECHRELEKMYVTRLGSLSRVPSLAVSPQEITSLALDSRSAFILGLVDGMSTVDMVLDMSGIPRLETLRVLLELVQQGVLKLG